MMRGIERIRRVRAVGDVRMQEVMLGAMLSTTRISRSSGLLFAVRVMGYRHTNDKDGYC